MVSDDDFIAAGLYDPDDPTHEGRLALLSWLVREGFTLEDMRVAKATLSLGAMSGDRRLIQGHRLTHGEAVAHSGLVEEEFDRLNTAFGFTPLDAMAGLKDGENWTVQEVETFAILGRIASMFSGDEALGFVRVMGSSIGRIADAAVSLFLNDIESPMIQGGGSEVDLARSVHEAIGLLDGLSAHLDPILRRQVLQAVQRSRRATIDPTERFNYHYAIGFIDLVGFTEISGKFDARELASFIRDFEGRAHDVVTSEGARIVKLIGDEIMFAATDADAACRAASALMEGFGEQHERVVPRGGLAFGEVLARGGDYYGSVVNLASRLVDEAVPQEVLVTDELVAQASDSMFAPAGRRMVKGFAEPIAVHSLERV